MLNKDGSSARARREAAPLLGHAIGSATVLDFIAPGSVELGVYKPSHLINVVATPLRGVITPVMRAQ
jgi:hypothetical protein